MWPIAMIAHRGDQPAAPPDKNAPYSELRRWRDAVDRHRPGEFDRAAIDIASLSERDLARVRDDLRELAKFLVRAHARLRNSGELSSFTDDGRSVTLGEAERLLGLTDKEAPFGDLTRVVMHGVILHIDIAIMVDDDRNRVVGLVSPPSDVNALIVRDGRQQGFVYRWPHWAFARTLLGMRSDVQADLLGRQWYAASAAFMQERTRLSELVPHLAAAMRQFPDDPGILFRNGLMHELMSSPELQTALREQPLPPGMKAEVRSEQAHLVEARTSFQRAVDRKPDFVEARIRLGRVLGQLGNHREAVRVLEGTATAGAGDRQRYLAALFLGRSQEALGQSEAAVQSFRRATFVFPRAQSPHLGLSRLARASGNHSAAVATLQMVLSLPADASVREDPWWHYYRGTQGEAAALLAEWRRSVINTWPR